MNRAKEDEERWKQTQVSKYYEPVRHGGREALDSMRRSYAEKKKALQDEVNAKEKELAELPKISVRISRADLEQAHEYLERIRGELIETKTSFEQIVQREAEEEAEANTSGTGNFEDQLQQLMNRVEKVNVRSTELEDVVQDITGDFPSIPVLIEETIQSQQLSPEEEALQAKIDEWTTALGALKKEVNERRETLGPLQARLASSETLLGEVTREQEEALKLRDMVTNLPFLLLAGADL